MKKFDIIILVIVFLCGISFSQKMNIHTSIGTDSYNLSDVDSITFDVSALIPTDGLLAYYPFNGNANDESGNGFNGIVSGAVLDTNRFGSPNMAYSFDGVNDYIKVPPIILGNERTISSWVKTTVTGVAQSIIFRGNVYWALYYYYFYITETGEFEYGHLPNGVRVTSENIAADSSWHHIVTTWDGSTCNLYFDGELEKAETYTLTPTGSSNDDVYIGAAHENNNSLMKFFNGYIDDVRIYNRVLTSNEVFLLYKEWGIK